MKKALTIAFAALTLSVLADTPPAPLTAPQPKPATEAGRPRRSRPVANLGGMLNHRTEGGVIRFVDVRGKDASDLTPLVAEVSEAVRVAADLVQAEKGKGCLEAARKALAAKEVAVAIVLADDGPDMPAVTVCPEDGMGVINVARLGGAGVSKEVLERRVKNEMLRVVGFVLGGYASMYPGVMKPVYAAEDLDALPLAFAPPVRGFIDEGVAKRGVAKIERVTYATAVKQGWAPAPTNDVQKAIWERAKAAAPAAK